MPQNLLNPKNNTAAELAEWIKCHEDIGVVCHISPDGDTLGSGLALAEALRKMGKNACTLCQDAVPDMYHFMPGVMDVCSPECAPFMLRSLLFCDVSDELRAGSCLMPEIRERALIDHHATNPAFADVNLIDGDAAATGVMVVELMDRLRIPLTPSMAENLYVGITTDTGNFSYPSTDGRTLRAGAKCLDAGADPDEITRRMFRLRTVARTQLLGAAVSQMQLLDGGKVAIFKVSKLMLNEFGAANADCEGIVNYGTETEGVRAAALLREQTGGRVKASLRSLGEVDVSRVALLHGGGGHAAAAGCTLVGGLDECAAIIASELSDEIARAEGR